MFLYYLDTNECPPEGFLELGGDGSICNGKTLMHNMNIR